MILGYILDKQNRMCDKDKEDKGIWSSAQKCADACVKYRAFVFGRKGSAACSATHCLCYCDTTADGNCESSWSASTDRYFITKSKCQK